MLETIADMMPLSERETKIVRAFVFPEEEIEELVSDPKWTGEKATRALRFMIDDDPETP